MFLWLRRMFISHDWAFDAEFDTYTCTVCGRREKPDPDDGVNLTARCVVWPGYPDAHLARSWRARRAPVGDRTLPSFVKSKH
jgi:hypothetical protein